MIKDSKIYRSHRASLLKICNVFDLDYAQGARNPRREHDLSSNSCVGSVVFSSVGVAAQIGQGLEFAEYGHAALGAQN